MEPHVALLVIASAVIHPLREYFIKDNRYPEGLTFSVIAMFGILSGVQVLVTGADPWAAAAVWPAVLISGAGVILFYYCTIATLRHGDLSIYYPIIRSSPLFVVVVGFLLLGQRYSPQLLLGVAVVLIGAFFLQYRPGVRLLDQPKALGLAVLGMSAHGALTLADAEALRVVTPMQFFFFLYLFLIPVAGVMLAMARPRGRPVTEHLFAGWRLTPGRYLFAGLTSYLSYYLLLTAFHLGGNVAAVSALRQISIPVSVFLGGMVLKESRMGGRLAWSAVLAVGVVIILVSR
jgi:drug/metabolite transporter (DMT)-like permease